MYEAFTARGIAKADLDGYELWEVAAALGGHHPAEEPADAEAAVDPYAGFDWVAENEAARREGRPPRLPRPRHVSGHAQFRSRPRSG